MMRLLYFFIIILLLSSCKTESKDKTVTDVNTHPELSKDSKIFLGNRLFSEKTCITCHAINRRKVGPSVVEIMTVYKEKNGNIVEFLRGKSAPIVDTTAAQVAIMQSNINGFLKNITDVELDAISTYMMHVDDLNSK